MKSTEEKHNSLEEADVFLQEAQRQITEKNSALETLMKTVNLPDRPTPLPTKQTFMRDFLGAVGDPDPAAQAKLSKEMGFG